MRSNSRLDQRNGASGVKRSKMDGDAETICSAAGREGCDGTERHVLRGSSPVAGGKKMAMRDHAVPPTSVAPTYARIWLSVPAEEADMRDAKRCVIARNRRRDREDECNTRAQARYAHRCEQDLAERKDAGTHDDGDET